MGKILSYSSEVLCGLFLIFSHLVIWYYSEERHYDLDEELHKNCGVDTEGLEAYHAGVATRPLTANTSYANFSAATLSSGGVSAAQLSSGGSSAAQSATNC